ncbi:outer membrane beta-barrel protein [Vibrio profundi]|uniref:outer membrane beta-barrel protein n=1 Tax=Vibrio profundi TaxID=1774960 RepID=UPI003734F950
MNRVLLNITALTLSFPSFASSNIVNELSYIGFGYKQTTFESGALSPYLNNQYENDEDKTLGGLYLDVGLNIAERFFIEGEADFVTRMSSEVDKWSIGAGFNAPINEAFSIPISCGAVNYRADSDYSSSYSEQAAYCKSGARVQVAKHWLVDLSYQRDFLEQEKDTIKLKNVFQFGRVFGLVAGFEAAKRQRSERSFNLGIQFTL